MGTEQKAGTETQVAKSDKEREAEIIWVISNRQDDRVVLHERDARHPGGEVFIGGPTPAPAYRTAEITRLLFSGEIIEIPEPPDGPKKPQPVQAVVPQTAPAQPGQPIRLGRKLDPDLVPKGALRAVEAKQESLPTLIASKATVPPPPKNSETQTS
jgi:hypothetical protein